MKQIKNTWLRAIAGLTLILGLIFVINDKTIAKNESEATQTSTTFYYNGPSTNLAADIMNPAYWSTSQEPEFQCGHDTEIPCSLSVPSGQTISQRLTTLKDLKGVQNVTTSWRNDPL